MSPSQPNRTPGWPPTALNALDNGEVALPSWRRDAACRDFPTDLFFPIGHGPRAEAQANQAKSICDQCPVRAECLDYSLLINAQFGVFGGLTEDERRRVRRSLGRQVRLSPAGLEGRGQLEASA